MVELELGLLESIILFVFYVSGSRVKYLRDAFIAQTKLQPVKILLGISKQ